MYRPDSVSTANIEAVREAGELMDRIFLLAGQIGELLASGDDFVEILENTDDSLVDLNIALAGLPVDFHFSGNGFTPNALPDGDVHPAYTHVQTEWGKFSEVYISDPADIDYMTKEELLEELEDEDEDISTVGVCLPGQIDPTVMTDLAELFLTPKPGPQLFVEFEVQRHTDAEEFMVGPCVRAHDYSVYYIMAASDLVIDMVDYEGEGVKPVDVEDLIGLLEVGSDQMRQIFRDTRFRRSSLKEQRARVNGITERFNAHAKLDRFTTVMSCDYLYAPVISQDNLQMAAISTDEISAFAFKPLRVDTLESFGLNNGHRIYSNNSMIDADAGLAIVGEVDDDTRERLRLQSPVVWIPISSQDVEAHFMP